MKWVLIAIAVIVLGLMVLAVVLGGGGVHGLSDAERKEWTSRFESLVAPLDQKRLGAGCKPFLASCEIEAGKGAGRIELRLLKDAKRKIHFEPHGEGVAFDLEVKLGADPSRVTVPEKGATLTLEPPCPQQTCELSLTSP